MKICRISLFLLVTFLAGSSSMFSQEGGWIFGKVTIRLSVPWALPPFTSDSMSLRVAVMPVDSSGLSVGAAMETQCCVVRTPCCPMCPSSETSLRSRGDGVYEFHYGFRGLPFGKYKVRLMVDSCTVSSKTAVAYARFDSLGTYSPFQGDPIYARIVEINRANPVRPNIDIYWAEIKSIR